MKEKELVRVMESQEWFEIIAAIHVKIIGDENLSEWIQGSSLPLCLF